MKIKIPDRDIPSDGTGKALLLPDGTEIALFCYKNKLYAIENCCPHEGGPLAEGTFDGAIVTCPWHSWQFDVRDGSCQNLIGIDAITYRVETTSDGTFIITK